MKNVEIKYATDETHIYLSMGGSFSITLPYLTNATETKIVLGSIKCMKTI